MWINRARKEQLGVPWRITAVTEKVAFECSEPVGCQRSRASAEAPEELRKEAGGTESGPSQDLGFNTEVMERVQRDEMVRLLLEEAHSLLCWLECIVFPIK